MFSVFVTKKLITQIKSKIIENEKKKKRKITCLVITLVRKGDIMATMNPIVLDMLKTTV